MRFLIALPLLLLLVAPVYAESVERVVDGDTVILSETGRARLSGIYAPELKQLGGRESREFLRLLIHDKEVYCLDLSKKDRYNRAICELYVGSHNINHIMVLHGWAWDYKEYSHGAYEDDMLDAQINKRGLWYEGSNNMQPWRWRRLK